MKSLCILFPLVVTAAPAFADPTPPNPIEPSVLVNGSDTCTTPDVIVGAGPHGWDNTAATTGAEGQANARCFIYGQFGITLDVWFEWTAPSSGWVQVTFCNLSANDSKIAVYAGSGCPTGEPVVCDDDGCGAIGLNARAPFLATAGTTYTIQVGSYIGTPASMGNFTIDPFTPGPGDDCAAPLTLTGPGPFLYDNNFSTTGFEGQSDPLCSSQMITYDSWYRWTAPCTGVITATQCSGTVGDTKMAVYNGATCPTGSAIACDDDACMAGGPSTIVFNATAGNTYIFQLGYWPGWIPGGGTLDIITPCPPVTGTPYCFGDGTGSPCPCGNNGVAGHGCAHSLSAQGALISATGNASLANDTLVLHGSDMTNSSCLYFQGLTQISSTFGDGLRCAGGQIVRLGTKTNVNGASQYPEPGNLSVSVRGGVTAPGVRNYQVWYRNAAAFCTVSTFNLSNGLSINWL